MRTLCLSGALVALAFATPTAQAPPRPNIVMVIMDDLGYGDVGNYGAPDAKTPNIDRLAREGVKFTDFYANHANCSPTRTAFITAEERGIRNRPGRQMASRRGSGLGAESSRVRRVLGISWWCGRLLHAQRGDD
jgi:hypothetical protein